MDPTIAPTEVFAALIEGVRAQVTPQQFSTWFKRMRLHSSERLHYELSVPNSFIRDWIDSYYRELLLGLLAAIVSKNARFELVVDDSKAPDAPPPASRPASRAPSGPSPGQAPSPLESPLSAQSRSTGSPPSTTPAGETGQNAGSPGAPQLALPSDAGFPNTSAGNQGGWTPAAADPSSSSPHGQGAGSQGNGYRGVPRRGNGRGTDRGERRRKYEERFQLFGHPRYRNFRSDVILNEDYRFENFVVGPSNHLPHAAALAVANAPGNAYNPLFLHGAVGLGKTHLLQGICASVLAKRPDARILYLSCETFVNQFIAAVEAGELGDFRYRYRHVDMLLIDDIHFLARKERTQEEFFHTFNTLYNSRKQIILSCDSPPREIPTLEERLVSRFKWGLVAQIEPPDHETRVSIVRRKARRRRVDLPDEICQLIADHISTNVRELEGAVLRVIGYASLTNKPLSLDLATEALRDVIQHAERKVTIESILRNVSEHFGVKTSELIGKRRHKSISRPRQVCMYLCRRLTDYSLVEIGGQIGGRDHTTVIYANDKIAREIQTNTRLREDLDILTRRIRAGK